MNEFAEALLELSKLCTTQYVTADGCITAKPCWVFKAISSPLTYGSASGFKLRNGETSSSETLLRICSIYWHGLLSDLLPIYFNKGLYLEITETNTEVTIQYLPD